MQIKSFHKDVDHLISSIKSLTFKNNTRKQMFISVSTLLDPVVTRWETRLESAFYYAKHFVEIKHIVNGITERYIVRECKRICKLQNSTLFFDQNFRMLQACFK